MLRAGRDETPLRGPRALKSQGTNGGASPRSEPSDGARNTVTAPFRFGAGAGLQTNKPRRFLFLALLSGRGRFLLPLRSAGARAGDLS